MIIFLTGYRCTGKTTVGKRLAELSGAQFVDADEALVAKAGMTVAEIVECSGWEHFRDLESDVLESLCSRNNCVVATGGGVILRDENVRKMKSSGSVVWLKASVETIAARMTGDVRTGDQRPGLTDKGPVQEIEETLTVRTPLYQSSMTISVETDEKSVDDICSEIIRQVQSDAE